MKSKKHLWSVPILAMFSLAALALALRPEPVVRQEGASPAPFSHGQTDLARLTKPQVLESYGKLPLSFEANHGQIDRQVKFLSRGRGYSLFLTSNEAVLSLSKTATPATQRRIDPVAMGQEGAENKAITTTVFRMRLVGAKPAAEISGLEELPGKNNYFIGNDPRKWRTNVLTYGKVRYREVYPGIDLVHYGNQGQLEHDFIVASGAEPSAILLEIEGGDRLSIDEQGDLVMSSRDGKVRLEKPVAYQEVDGVRKKVAAGYRLEGKRRVGFKLANYDQGRPLVIDPVLVYSTYLGGSRRDEGIGIAVDSSGNAYVTGRTLSTNFPTTPGAFQTTSGGSSDAFVTKLNPTGSALVYSTYLGGSGGDISFGIAVDSSGNAYVTGGTGSTDFPTTIGAFQTTFVGFCGDAFVTKLNPTGSALVYSTYLGGSSCDEGLGIAVDSSGNAYVTGNTQSTNFPTTTGAFQTTSGGFFDAFVSKLNPTGSALVYSTYLGGSGTEEGRGIAVDSLGNAYVTGETQSTNFPTTPGAFQTTFGGSDDDAFVTKLNPAGSALVYSTYLGGSGVEFGFGIAVDSSGNAYVTGFTRSTNFPTTTGAFQTTSGGGDDAFVTKLNLTGSALVYSTYLGGSSLDEGLGIAVDFSGNAYVTGDTQSTNFPTTTGAFQTMSGGSSDAFVTKLNPTGSALVYSTYLGGSSDDHGRGIAVDFSGDAYVTGDTQSTNFPTTTGAFQTTFGGRMLLGSDLALTLGVGGGIHAFVAKITDFAFLSSGSFVIGDLDATVGNAVTFWGAHWAKVNSLSGGPAPNSFKGFADTAPQSCGGSWTSRPGNSSNPPDNVPPFMAVIASSSITKSGSTISGDVPKIVIVKTNPGYGPSPGHTGTGTVVAVLCAS